MAAREKLRSVTVRLNETDVRELKKRAGEQATSWHFLLRILVRKALKGSERIVR